MAAQLDSLFPAPSSSIGKLLPRTLGGATAGTVHAVTESLKDNHQKSHVFYNDLGYHNHTSHHLLALYALGADEKLVRSAYAVQAAKQRKVITPPSPITNKNFADHLGDDNFYSSYLAFFIEVVLKHGASGAIEKYIFASEVNTPSTRLICRLMSGLLHPLIHIGHGVEFNLPGLVAEGLAQACVHSSYDSEIYASSLCQASSTGSGIASVLSPILSKLTLNSTNATTHNGTSRIHALAILHELHELQLPFTPYDEEHVTSVFSSTPETVTKIRELAEKWFSNLALDTPGGLEDAIEQLAWTTAVVYGVGSWDLPQKGEFRPEFYIVHAVTSSLFLPSIAKNLNPASQRKLLGAYFTSLISMYVWHYSPKLPIKSFFEGPLPSAHPENVEFPKAHAHALEIGAQGPNPWLGIINNSMHHPEEHVPKTIRALEHWASLYGTTPSGRFTKEEIGWEDAEYIDGTLFVRTALLTTKALGRVADGEDDKEFFLATLPPEH